MVHFNFEEPKEKSYPRSDPRCGDRGEIDVLSRRYCNAVPMLWIRNLSRRFLTNAVDVITFCSGLVNHNLEPHQLRSAHDFKLISTASACKVSVASDSFNRIFG
jgi:hypothetical protein